MTVYRKIVTIKITDPKRPSKEFEIYQRQYGGIDAVLLQQALGLREADFEFICSDNHPETPRNMEDIDRLLANSNIKILREPSSHPKDPVNSGKANQSLLIESNLDNPNIPDRFLSKAKNVHDEWVPKEQIKKLNERIDNSNKQISNESDRLKYFSEEKETVRVGEVERE